MDTIQRETFEEETFANWWKYDFCREKLSQIACLSAPKDTTPPNFTEKTLWITPKISKFVKISQKFSAIWHALHCNMLISQYKTTTGQTQPLRPSIDNMDITAAMSCIPDELPDYHTQRSDNQHTAKVQAKNGLLLKVDSRTDTNKSAKISSKLWDIPRALKYTTSYMPTTTDCLL